MGPILPCFHGLIISSSGSTGGLQEPVVSCCLIVCQHLQTSNRTQTGWGRQTFPVAVSDFYQRCEITSVSVVKPKQTSSDRHHAEEDGESGGPTTTHNRHKTPGGKEEERARWCYLSCSVTLTANYSKITRFFIDSNRDNRTSHTV